MPNKERRLKEKEELRQHILNAAREIAVTDGWQNVTIRKICAQIRYTAPVVYQHFESKEQILQSLRREGFLQVFNKFEAVKQKYWKPEKRLFEYALTWWNFALEHPEIYQVMFNLQGALCLQNEANARVNNNVVEYYNPEFSLLNRKAKRSVEYQLELTDNFIAIIHGFISMKMANKAKSADAKAVPVFKSSLLRFLNSINDINN